MGAKRVFRTYGAIAICAVGTLTACSGTNQSEAWFPLDTAAPQTYAVRTQRGDEVSTQTWTQRAIGPAPWEGGVAYVRTHSEGVEFYLRKTADGSIERVAHRTVIDHQPIADEAPRTVLKAPFAVGTEWKTQSVPYVLRRKNEYPYDLKHSHKVQLDWKIEALDERVETRAGTYSPCLRAVGRGALNLYTDPVAGFANVPIVSTEWYCKGVGLAKWIRSEKVRTGFFVGGEITAELVK
jgi:hypothetical protein